MSISKLQLQRAFSRTEGYRKITPLIKSDFLSHRWKADVWLKCEQFQTIGAFKIRGAANFTLRLTEDERRSGFVTHSSGNHAQAIAYMAKLLNTKAYVVMPENSNQLKVEYAKRWGAEVTICASTIDARVSTAAAIADKTGAVLVPPFDHEWIVEGQATAAMEIIQQEGKMDTMVAPLGGGGLLAGTALAAHYFGSDVEVIGAEPTLADDGYRGFKSGVRQPDVLAQTVADGLRTTVGEVPFKYIQSHVKDVILAEENEIIRWMYTIWRESKLIIEPSCAVPFAAMDAEPERWKGKRIAIIITGGNVDLRQLPGDTAI